MSTSDIIFIAIAFFALGLVIYRKYIRKDQEQTRYGQSKGSGSSFTSHSKDDDYEPYSKK